MFNIGRGLRAVLTGIRQTPNLDNPQSSAILETAEISSGTARIRDGAQKRILMIDDLVPDPQFGAGYPRAFAIVSTLVEAGHQVSFYPMTSSAADLEKMEASFRGSVKFHPGAGSRGLRRLLRQSGSEFDILFISRPTPMRAYVHLRWNWRILGRSTSIVYDAEAVLSAREKHRRLLFGNPMSEEQLARSLKTELNPVRYADLVTAVSHSEAVTIQSVLRSPVVIIPHAVTCNPGSRGIDERQDFLFVGRLTGSRTESPNVDSVIWFLTEVMPLLDLRLGRNYKLHLAGMLGSPEIEALLSDRIVAHGIVENLNGLYDTCRVFIAPTRFSAGIPLKVVEAMGHGIPCVVTSLLADQLHLPSNFAIGRSASHFAEECQALYIDRERWLLAREGGLRHIGTNFSQQAFHDAVSSAIDGVQRVR